MSLTQQRLAASLAELARSLHAAHVPFALAGAHAVAIHGHVRATTDIDVLLRDTHRADAVRVLRALGYRLEAASAAFEHHVRAPFAELPGVVERVDLLVSSRELGQRALEEAARETITWSGVQVPVVPVPYLVLMKLMANAADPRREHDLADARALLALHHARLDLAALRHDAGAIDPALHATLDAVLRDALAEPAPVLGEPHVRL